MTYQSLGNITTMQEMLYQLRDITNGVFFFMLPASISALIMVVGMVSGKRLSFTAIVASFIFFIISIILAFMNLLNPFFAVLGVILTGLCVIWNKFDGTN